eukprot:545394_1
MASKAVTEAKTSIEMQSDLQIFKNTSNNCKQSHNSIYIVSNCDYMKRLAMSLKYFDLLMNENRTTNNLQPNQLQNRKDILIKFCNEIYTDYLDDFYHFIKKHGSNEDLIEIAKELMNKYGFIECNTLKCNKLQRHNRNREKTIQKKK